MPKTKHLLLLNFNIQRSLLYSLISSKKNYKVPSEQTSAITKLFFILLLYPNMHLSVCSAILKLWPNTFEMK